MAGTDSGGVNERLNGLISLLQSVGIDGVDSDALLEQQKRSKTKSNSNKNTPKKRAVDNSAAATSSDAQILEIVKKLQQAQVDSPEIFEALKSPELLALASLAAQTKGLQASAPEPVKPVATSLDDVIDDDDDNYPKIGPGYSDDISVVSELSTPTVMTRQQVSDEEYYREVKPGGQGALSSMPGGLAGSRLSRATPNRPGLGAGKLSAGKTRNMVGQVRPLAARRALPTIPAIPAKPTGGGAAAQRRLNYQMAMSKLESDGFGNPPQDITDPISPTAAGSNKDNKDKKLARTVSGTKSIGSGSGGGGSKRKPRSTNSKIKTNDDINWGMADEDGWPAFEDLKNNSSNNDFFVDSDGFFSDNVFSSNDGSNGAVPSSSSKSRKKKSDKSGDGSASSGSKKKISREDRGSTRKAHRMKKDRDSERALSDDDREGSTRRSHRLKKDKDTLSDDGIGTSRKSKSKKDKDKDKDKDKSGRRKARRASMV